MYCIHNLKNIPAKKAQHSRCLEPSLTSLSKPHISHINNVLTLTYLCQNSGSCHFPSNSAEFQPNLMTTATMLNIKNTPPYTCVCTLHTQCVCMTSCQHMAAWTYCLHIQGKQASESSKILVPIYQTTWCHISEYHNVKQTSLLTLLQICTQYCHYGKEP
jgi:hypothetical protein